MGALSRIVFSKVISSRSLREAGFLKQWKRLCYHFLLRLPNSDGSLADWGPLAREAVKDFLDAQCLKPELDLSQNLKRIVGNLASAPVSAFVRAFSSNHGLVFKVIHQGKGETYEAVMVVGDRGNRSRPDDLAQWLSYDVTFDEERRVGYVGVTRPRKLLVLAVPDNTSTDLLESLLPFYDISGFVDDQGSLSNTPT